MCTFPGRIKLLNALQIHICQEYNLFTQLLVLTLVVVLRTQCTTTIAFDFVEMLHAKINTITLPNIPFHEWLLCDENRLLTLEAAAKWLLRNKNRTHFVFTQFFQRNCDKSREHRPRIVQYFLFFIQSARNKNRRTELMTDYTWLVLKCPSTYISHSRTFWRPK